LLSLASKCGWKCCCPSRASRRSLHAADPPDTSLEGHLPLPPSGHHVSTEACEPAEAQGSVGEACCQCVSSSYNPFTNHVKAVRNPSKSKPKNLAVTLLFHCGWKQFSSPVATGAAGCTMFAPDDAAVSLLLYEARILLGIDKWVASCNAVNLEHLQVIFQLMLSGWGASNSSLAAPQ